MLRLALAVVLLTCVNSAPHRNTNIYNFTDVFDVKGKIESDGFYSEIHHIVTKDGYILEINRIPYGRIDTQTVLSKPIVLLMHGLQNSALSYMMIGAELSMAYNLADAGFDVWLANARGVLNSRNHIQLNPDHVREKMEFFDFTFEEIALLDLPSMVDYILEYTGEEKLNFIGHSQGGTVFLILNSMKPEYNKKFSSAHLLAAVGYQDHFPNRFLKMMAVYTNSIYASARRQGYVEVFGPEWNEVNNCNEDDESEDCDINVKDILIQIFGPEVFAGAAVKQFAHYGQNIRDRSFRRWNYGLLNFIYYGTLSPPVYDLSLITADVTMHYTVNDALLAEEDVVRMVTDMPNAVTRKVARETFTHSDFMTALDTKTLVTDHIIEEIRKIRINDT